MKPSSVIRSIDSYEEEIRNLRSNYKELNRRYEAAKRRIAILEGADRARQLLLKVFRDN